MVMVSLCSNKNPKTATRCCLVKGLHMGDFSADDLFEVVLTRFKCHLHSKQKSPWAQNSWNG